jgi:DNA-directed RNA polymerase subunit RPC12/RpoP
MKSVCKYCSYNKLVKWGERRRFCSNCKRTFSVPKAGRKPIRNRDMYLLDRSTYQRIGHKQKYSAAGILYLVQKEIKILPTPTDRLKKIYTLPQAYLSLTLNTLKLKANSIVNF